VPETPTPCRFCAAPVEHVFVDLGLSPLCESFIKPEDLNRGETFYPLKVWVCGACKLVQLQEYVAADEIFDDYAYFSSFSDSWLKHAATYCEQVSARFGLDAKSFVVEVASNDGYLLRNFVEAGVPCLGVEPSWTVAEAAKKVGVESLVKFFGRDTATELAAERGKADLILGNNVLAHVPDLNDFVGGLPLLLASEGVVTMEFPHLMRLMDEVQYDTIYHEHFSYLSLLTVQRIFAAHGLELFDVEQLASHGGSLRVYAKHAGASHQVNERVHELLARETAAGFDGLEVYLDFPARVEASKRATLSFLIQAREEGKRVVAYGAPGKGNTLLNYCGISTDMIEYAVDRNPYKHGRYTPGAHLPIFPPKKLEADDPDYVLILPWNLQREIAKQLAPLCAKGTRLVVPIPTLTVLETAPSGALAG
jgi:SAM-dependent methyltransferase